MISLGADPDLIDNNGQTPIFYSIKFNKPETLDYLLKNGARLNIVDKKGSSPMTFAKR